MREYETVFITQPNLADSQHKQLIERFKSTIERHEGRLFYARDMGKKTLAYQIAKQRKGLYTCLDYAAKGGAVSEIERAMRLDENVIRFLTIVRKEDVNIEARAQEIEACGEDKTAPAAEMEMLAAHAGNDGDNTPQENSFDEGEAN